MQACLVRSPLAPKKALSPAYNCPELVLACYERKSSAAAPFVYCIILWGHIAIPKTGKKNKHVRSQSERGLLCITAMPFARADVMM